MTDTNRKTILGVPVDALQPQEFIAKIIEGLKHPETRTIFAVNAEKIMFARKDPEIFNIIQSSDFLIPDGFGPVVGLKLTYGIKITRTTGVGLMFKLLEVAEKENASVFFLGAKPDVLETAIENVISKHPGIKLAGKENGYLPEAEHARLIERINASGADLLFVALGSPKQEKWMHLHKKELKVKYCVGVGGSIDVLAGKAQLAPAWISNLYLEWIYRLIKNPSRFKRQKTIPVFILKMLWGALRNRVKK